MSAKKRGDHAAGLRQELARHAAPQRAERRQRVRAPAQVAQLRRQVHGSHLRGERRRARWAPQAESGWPARRSEAAAFERRHAGRGRGRGTLVGQGDGDRGRGAPQGRARSATSPERAGAAPALPAVPSRGECVIDGGLRRPALSRSSPWQALALAVVHFRGAALQLVAAHRRSLPGNAEPLLQGRGLEAGRVRPRYRRGMVAGMWWKLAGRDGEPTDDGIRITLPLSQDEAGRLDRCSAPGWSAALRNAARPRLDRHPASPDDCAHRRGAGGWGLHRDQIVLAQRAVTGRPCMGDERFLLAVFDDAWRSLLATAERAGRAASGRTRRRGCRAGTQGGGTGSDGVDDSAERARERGRGLAALLIAGR